MFASLHNNFSKLPVASEHHYCLNSRERAVLLVYPYLNQTARDTQLAILLGWAD